MLILNPPGGENSADTIRCGADADRVQPVGTYSGPSGYLARWIRAAARIRRFPSRQRLRDPGSRPLSPGPHHRFPGKGREVGGDAPGRFDGRDTCSSTRPSGLATLDSSQTSERESRMTFDGRRRENQPVSVSLGLERRPQNRTFNPNWICRRRRAIVRRVIRRRGRLDGLDHNRAASETPEIELKATQGTLLFSACSIMAFASSGSRKRWVTRRVTAWRTAST
jgi:hypothetical protein